MRAVVLAISLAACTPVQRVAVLMTTSTTLIALDWYQTQDIVKGCTELNPVLGECGERIPPSVYFPVVILTHVSVGLALPGHARTAWFSTIIGAQASTTWGNAHRK